MIARIKDYFYRLRGTLAIRPIRRNPAQLSVPPDSFTKQCVEHGVTEFARTLASAAATVEEVTATARAIADAMQPIIEIQAAITDPDQVRILLDLARGGGQQGSVRRVGPLSRCPGRSGGNALGRHRPAAGLVTRPSLLRDEIT